MKIQSIQTFGTPTFSDYYLAAEKAVQNDINSLSSSQILGTSTKELAEYMLQNYLLSPLEIDESRQVEYEKISKKEVFLER
jgi:hypothetical protein